ncbi:hypothetical protein SIN_0941 [Streptococcus infantis SK1302]|uniref:Uncharacterized protein n=1 Tax=Streptococcus infantis SK1302 TaxID=871237 RepID=A0ABN0B534_9STRE|nr:hypothetical protein SIN_0941 [Streptococcus infantis SK1302]
MSITNGYSLEFMTGIEDTVLPCPKTTKKPTDQARKFDTIGFF